MLKPHSLTFAKQLLSLGRWTLSKRWRAAPLLLSARDDREGRHYAVGYHLDGTQRFATQITQRCHAIIDHPHEPIALFVARRPGTEIYLIDMRNGRLLQVISSPANRHFYGHAVIHRSGDWLYTTENDTTEPGRGVLGVYRFHGRQLTRVSEVSSHGIGPHELAWLPDGETLVVANGGIRTEAESRTEMNLNAMEPSLVLLQRNGSLISKERLPDAMNSIRHLAVATDATILACQQFMGEASAIAPLLAIKRPGEAFAAFPISAQQLQAMAHYTASVAVHSQRRLVAVTAPRANRIFIWDLDSAAVRLDAPMPDCAGVAAMADGFVVTSGQGRCRFYDCSRTGIPVSKPLELPAGLWDNHLQMLGQSFIFSSNA